MRFVAAVLLLVLNCGAPGNPPAPDSPAPDTIVEPAGETALLRIGGQEIAVDVVRTPEERRLGLMYRTSLAPDSGMLFIFEQTEIRRFWMKNTLIPLSIAYIDTSNVVTDVLEMAPGDTITPYTSSRPALYAFEMNAGWFQTHGIKPGDTIFGIPD